MHSCTNKKKLQQQEHRIRGTGGVHQPPLCGGDTTELSSGPTQPSVRSNSHSGGRTLPVCPIPCVNTRHQAAHTIRLRARAMSLTQHGDQELLHNPDTSESGQGEHGWLLRKTVGTSLWYGKKGHPHLALKSSLRGVRG